MQDIKERSRSKARYFKLLRRQRIDSASLCSLAGRYDNPIPNRFLAPIDCSNRYMVKEIKLLKQKETWKRKQERHKGSIDEKKRESDRVD
jgi:hypothetical protein